MLLVVIAALLTFACGTDPRGETGDPTATARTGPSTLMIFAAASLEDVVREMGERFASEAGTTIVYNFAGSNVLARQIDAAPGADLFISADQKWMDHLQARNRIDRSTRCTPISNRLAVIVNARCPFTLERAKDLARVPLRHLALADPAGVPAGRYARAYLEGVMWGEASLWDALSSRVAPAPDVRAAVALVESDPEIVGIVYRTEARRSDRVRTAFEVPAGEGPTIEYAAAVPSDARNPGAARAFLDFLCSDVATGIWESYGFVAVVPPTEEGTPR